MSTGFTRRNRHARSSHDHVDDRARKMFLALMAIAVIGAPIAWLVGCGAFVGPATHQSSEYYFSCDDGNQCLVGRERCSSTKPRRCIADWVYGDSRDGGAQ